MEIVLADSSNGPVYMQVRQQIESAIRGKVLAPGASLPALTSVAQKLSVDKGEIQRAYFELEQAGLIVKKTGKDFLGKVKTSYVVK